MNRLLTPRRWPEIVHIAVLHGLPILHKDPFHRVLIAQATAEPMVLVTTDGEIPRYASARLQVVS